MDDDSGKSASAQRLRAKEDTFSLSAAEQEAYEESIDKVTEDFYWEYDHSSLSFGAQLCRRQRRK